MPRKRTATSNQSAPDPPEHLLELLRQVDEEHRRQELEAQQRVDGASHQARARAQREAVREELHRAFELAGQCANDPGNKTFALQLADQLVAAGRALVCQNVATVLDSLPAPGTPEVTWLLPLRFAISLLKTACNGDRSQVLAVLEQLAAYPTLQGYYQWFGGLADRLVGYTPLPGVPATIQTELPLPEGDRSLAALTLAEHALGLRICRSLTSPPADPPAPVDPTWPAQLRAAMERLHLLHDIAVRCADTLLRLHWFRSLANSDRLGSEACIVLRGLVDELPEAPFGNDPFRGEAPVAVAGVTATSTHAAIFEIARTTWERMHSRIYIPDGLGGGGEISTAPTEREWTALKKSLERTPALDASAVPALVQERDRSIWMLKRRFGFAAPVSSAQWAPDATDQPMGSQADQDTVAAVSKPAPVLSTRQYTHLEAMYHLKAFAVESRQTIGQIVERSEGRGATVEAHKEPISDLKKRGLIATRKGRDGGCWLTAEGRACIERFLAQRTH